MWCESNHVELARCSVATTNQAVSHSLEARECVNTLAYRRDASTTRTATAVPHWASAHGMASCSIDPTVPLAGCNDAQRFRSCTPRLYLTHSRCGQNTSAWAFAHNPHTHDPKLHNDNLVFGTLSNQHAPRCTHTQTHTHTRATTTTTNTVTQNETPPSRCRTLHRCEKWSVRQPVAVTSLRQCRAGSC